MHAMPDHAEEDPPRFKPHDRVFIKSSHPNPTLGGKYADVIEIKLDNISIEGKRENAYRYEVGISGSGRPAVVSERFLETAKKDQPLFSLGDHVRIKGFNYNGTITGHRRGESGGWIYTIRISTAQTTTAREVELELAESEQEMALKTFKIGDDVWIPSLNTTGIVSDHHKTMPDTYLVTPDDAKYPARFLRAGMLKHLEDHKQEQHSKLQSTEFSEGFKIGDYVKSEKTLGKDKGSRVGRIIGCGEQLDCNLLYRVKYGDVEREFRQSDLKLVETPVPTFQIGDRVQISDKVLNHGGHIGRIFYVCTDYTTASEDGFVYRVEIEATGKRGPWSFREADLKRVDQPSEEKETICAAHLNDDMPAPDSGNSTAEAARHVLKHNISPWARDSDKIPMAAREEFGKQSVSTVGELRAFAQQGD